MKDGKYIIAKRDEETDCEQCGYPLVKGNSAYQTENFSHVYCCKFCADIANGNVDES